MINMTAKTEKKEEIEIDIFQSELVPKHEIVTENEKAELLRSLKVTLKQLPRIKEDDPVAKKLGAKHGDVLRITSNSPVAGECYYYRVVV